MKCQLVTTPQAAILRQRAERVTLLFKECVYRVAGYEQYCVWGWVSVCSRFFKSSHFSLSLLPIFLLAWPCSAAAVCSGPTGCVDCGSLGPPSIGGQLSTPRFRFRLSVPAASWTGLGGVTVPQFRTDPAPTPPLLARSPGSEPRHWAGSAGGQGAGVAR